ncbi:tRNA(Met) cytidine acetyltransferase [Aggregatibacter sp. oral taxon 513]|uniref:tRNA(Met) cytidine acetyltransferase TmcA n=1 Tax=Aggregatibacter sp. oral taxon 513 TaxID=712150 RepID=UPI001BA47787|nr:GNAT family N-acetyltransferase [Aggregatibacter sp. oral taxon 513]QUC05448.1 tRNA(Met) cytidine acetyltransferase [Aggregatibacter sp. oral taxon 513]
MSRELLILVGEDDFLAHQLNHNLSLKSAVWIGDVSPHFATQSYFPFSKTKNLLGSEFLAIIYDARQGIHLDALAIAAGTLQDGGQLLLLLNHWADLANQPDCDSLRWSGEKYAINTPHFIAFLQEKIAKYGFPIYQNTPLNLAPQMSQKDRSTHCQPTLEQARLLQQMAEAEDAILIITAKRGRGKSALAGLFAKQQVAQNQPVILTAPNKSAVNIFNAFARAEITFMSPDELSQNLSDAPQQFANHWLFVDEVAIIPLDILFRLTNAFKRVVLTTTIHSYEGTGRGFLLKFMAKTDRTLRHFELFTPLRWQTDDKLEAFIDDLLLCDCEDRLPQPPCDRVLAEQIQISYCERIPHDQIESVYGLLTLAHYRTSPLDLRRLLDAPQQQFYLAQAQDALLGCVWAVPEGGIEDNMLIHQIRRGERRPRGNLVAQMLCFQAGVEEACALRSLRISRIAVQPNWQQQGLGQRLIAKMKQQQMKQQGAVDFLSVSFGYTPELLAFWQKCGFVLVHFSESKEASSGCYSVVALCPLSEEGRVFVQRAEKQFQRNLPLSLHPLATQFARTEIDWTLERSDWQSLKDFADFFLPLSSVLPSIRRLITSAGEAPFPLLADYCKQPKKRPNKKTWLENCRFEVKKWLQKNPVLL